MSRFSLPTEQSTQPPGAPGFHSCDSFRPWPSCLPSLPSLPFLELPGVNLTIFIRLVVSRLFPGELRCLNEEEPSASHVSAGGPGVGGWRGGSLLPHAGFPLVAERGGDSSLPWEGFSLSWLLLLWSLGPGAHALQMLRLTGLAALRPVGASRTRG